MQDLIIKWILIAVSFFIVAVFAFFCWYQPAILVWLLFLASFFIIPALLGWYGLKSIKLLIIVNVLFSVILLTTTCIYFSMGGPRVDGLQGFLLILMFYGLVLFIISVIACIAGLRKGGRKILFLSPVAILIITFFLQSPFYTLAYKIQMHIFNQRLPQYEKAVATLSKQIEDEPIGFGLYGNKIPEEFRHLAPYGITVEKSEQDGLLVEFCWKAGIPVKHSIYLYTSKGEFPSDEGFRRQWSSRYRINENWFCATD